MSDKVEEVAREPIAPSDVPIAPTDDDIESIGDKALFGVGGPGGRKFALGKDAPVCDVVMKGGVTSGVVYPYAILRLAQKFRLAGIGGTSAGAIASALTAAAEYGRQNNDPASFSRFESWCIEIPNILRTLFQPSPRHRTVFGFAMALMEAADPGPSLGERLRSAARVFHTRAAVITLALVAGSMFGGMLAAIRYISHYGVGSGLGPETGWMNPGAAAALVSASLGLLGGFMLIGLFGVALTLKKRWPMWTYLGLLGVAAVVSILGDLGSLYAVAAPAVLGGALGVVAATIFIGDRVIADLRETDFGLCSGRTEGAAGPAGLTDWLHAAIQDVAGRPDGPPLTFGDVEGAAPPGEPRLALRMIVTNLTLRRPYALPDLGGKQGRIGWRPSEWTGLFPPEVINHMIALGPSGLSLDDKRPLPDGAQLPVVVGARMSLSFPVLFAGIPVYDLSIRKSAPPQTAGMSKRRAAAAMEAWRRRGRMLLVDGGLSSNLPLHFFDNLGPPAYPTFAFNLEDSASVQRRTASGKPLDDLLHADPLRLERAHKRKADLERLAHRRISLHGPRKWQPRLKRMPDGLFRDYLGGLLGAAKDWQDNLLSIMPGQFDRIVTIRLAKGEGGLNLTMPPERSKLLMQLGYLAGRELAEKFDLQAHRVRRALAAYQEIERVADLFGRNWKAADLAKALAATPPPKDSARAWTATRENVVKRLTSLARWARRTRPALVTEHFPRPRGSLRITPNLSGDL